MGTQPGGNTHRKDKLFLLMGGNFQCLRLGPFKGVRPCAFLPSNPSLGIIIPPLRCGNRSPERGSS